MINRHLFGFYRNNAGIIDSIYSDQSEFEDYGTLSNLLRASVVPLTVSRIDSQWHSFHDTTHLDPILQSIFEHQMHMITTDSFQHGSEIMGTKIGVLMHVPVHSPTMCRTGVLVKYCDHNDQWDPMIVYVNEQPFIVECKGIGCATGGFASIHSRKQAGTDKYHQRVTGGFTLDCMEKECQHLLSFMAASNDPDYCQVMPLAAIGFQYGSNDDCLDMGLLLRLTPSNVRFSYQRFGTVELPEKGSEYRYFYRLMDYYASIGFRHGNVNSNNMVYVKPDHFVLTDFEELESILTVPATLDKDPLNVPLYLNIYPYRYQFMDAFTDSLESYQLTMKQYVMDHPNYDTEIQSRFQSSWTIFSEYYRASALFVGDAYFQYDLLDWCQHVLRPLLCQQQKCCQALLNDDSGELSLPDIEAITQSFLNFSDDDVFALPELGDLYQLTNVSNCFVYPIISKRHIIYERLHHINYVLRQLDVVLTGKNDD